MGPYTLYYGTESTGEACFLDSLSCKNSVEQATHLYRFDNRKTGVSSL
jgi:hypothetical protein